MGDVKAEEAAKPAEPEKVTAAATNADDVDDKPSLSELVVAAQKAVAAGGDDNGKEALAALESLRGFKVR